MKNNDCCIAACSCFLREYKNHLRKSIKKAEVASTRREEEKKNIKEKSIQKYAAIMKIIIYAFFVVQIKNKKKLNISSFKRYLLLF